MPQDSIIYQPDGDHRIWRVVGATSGDVTYYPEHTTENGGWAGYPPTFNFRTLLEAKREITGLNEALAHFQAQLHTPVNMDDVESAETTLFQTLREFGLDDAQMRAVRVLTERLVDVNLYYERGTS